MNESILSELEALIRQDQRKFANSRKQTVSEALMSKLAGNTNHLCLKKDITYIVAVVALQDDRVLMMRESKDSCCGKWYLPAGRMDENESIVEAAKRETLEETGLEFEPESLIRVEFNGGFSWIRFTLAGHVTGGTLKTIENRDKESMEAQWYTPQEIKNLPFRCTDMFYLIELGVKWFKKKTERGQENVYHSLPVLTGYPCHKVKIILVQRPTTSLEDADNPSASQHSKLLLETSGSSVHFPECSVKKQKIVYFEQAIDVALKACGLSAGQFVIKGVLAVEHTGKPHGQADGTCFTLIAEITNPLLIESHKSLSWLTVKDTELNQRLNKLLEPGMCIPFMSE